MTVPKTIISDLPVCYQIRLTGRVQGVGYRPFVYRMAVQNEVVGEVSNVDGAVHIIAQGKQESIIRFQQALIHEAPQISRPQIESSKEIDLRDVDSFHIVNSATGKGSHVHVPPDYFTCTACQEEMNDRQNRRYNYPFINCTQCGPRYTLIKSLPYDRVNTSMAAFTLCPACEREYRDPNDRRYHAEPLACPECGPQLTFQTSESIITNSNEAIATCVTAIHSGEIVAIKGIGGYHLCCDATNQEVIDRLRQLKARPDKPLALMFPEQGQDGLQFVTQHAELDSDEAASLVSPGRPIVLVKKKTGSTLPDSIAPGLDQIGVMLPYSPLHHLLLKKLQKPIVATSANVGGEPVLTGNEEVEKRLEHITSNFLHHNRSIVRPADDSVLRYIAQRPRPFRIGRGMAPLELRLPFMLDKPMLACGGQMKNTVALAFDDRIVISPHIGDMGTVRSQQVFENVIQDLQALYHVEPEYLVCDAHPGYTTSRWARQQKEKCIEIFHHHAHAACLPGEFPHEQHWLIFTWDGVGYGMDETLWGGETFYGQPGEWQRIATMRPFHLPGGEKVAREPWRSALATSWEIDEHWQQCPFDKELIFAAWQKRINTPKTTAVGRLFDAAAALLDLSHTASYEGQAPMLLESHAQPGNGIPVNLPINESPEGLLQTDWAPLFQMLHHEVKDRSEAAFVFHISMAQVILEQAHRLRDRFGEFAVGLCGGVFQNKLLTELVLDKLTKAGFRAYLPASVPVNDAGLCFGQIVEAASVQGKNDE